MPLLDGLLSDGSRNSGDVERRPADGEVLVLAVVDDGAREAVVDAQREVLLDRQELDRVVVPVSQQLVAEHGAHGVVADVVGHSDPSAEELDGLGH